MYPLLEFGFLRSTLVPTELVMAGLGLLAAFLLGLRLLRSNLSEPKVLALISFVAAMALMGGRTFHVVFERPELLSHPALIFTRWDGLTFYGAFIGGAVALFLFSVFLIEKPMRTLVWNIALLLTMIEYAWLRLGCFLNGCCWGKLSSLPWAITYTDPHSEMPILGLPVHPVQIYDMAAGAFIAGVLSYKMKIEGRQARGLWKLALILFAALRFVTEIFRGDSYRGVGFAGWLSTSQIISIALLVGLCLILLIERLPKINVRAFAVFGTTAAIAVLLTGCFSIHPPTAEDIARTTTFPDFSVYTLWPHKTNVPNKKNLILLTADGYLQNQFEPLLQKAFSGQTPPKIQDLIWWQLVPSLRKTYNYVIWLNEEQTHFKTLSAAIHYFESLNQPYDLVVLSHGFPNFLSDGVNGYFLSYQEIDAWKGQLKNLDLVYMQACYSASLAADWIAAGAQHVLAFRGLNQNFFYADFFLQNIAKMSADQAAIETTENMQDLLSENAFYSSILKAMNLTVDDYIRQVEKPVMRDAK